MEEYGLSWVTHYKNTVDLSQSDKLLISFNGTSPAGNGYMEIAIDGDVILNYILNGVADRDEEHLQTLTAAEKILGDLTIRLKTAAANNIEIRNLKIIGVIS
jgi:hypothetical protein